MVNHERRCDRVYFTLLVKYKDDIRFNKTISSLYFIKKAERVNILLLVKQIY